jgi:hypothetical protein
MASGDGETEWNKRSPSEKLRDEWDDSDMSLFTNRFHSEDGSNFVHFTAAVCHDKSSSHF